MASKEALCRIRVNCSSLSSENAHNTAGTELIFGQPDPADKSISTPQSGSLRVLHDCLDIPLTDNPPTFSTSTKDTQVKVYPAGYRLPKPITDQLSSARKRSSASN